MSQDSKFGIPKAISFTKTYHHEPYDYISPKKAEHSAAGKNVVVTGGGTGIGKAIAIAFSQAGAKSVSILGRRQPKLESAAAEIHHAKTQENTRVIYQVADLMDRQRVEAAMDAIRNQVGKIDIFVSNAASLLEVRPLLGYPEKALMHAFDLNVLSAFNAISAFIPLAGDNPVLLNISTSLAHTQPLPGLAAYGVSKAANLKLVDFFAVENPQIHVVNVQPGVVATEFFSDHEDMLELAQDSVDLPGHFCVWLASPQASFLRGKFVWANWDVPELLERKEEIQNSRLMKWTLEGVPM